MGKNKNTDGQKSQQKEQKPKRHGFLKIAVNGVPIAKQFVDNVDTHSNKFVGYTGIGGTILDILNAQDDGTELVIKYTFTETDEYVERIAEINTK